MGIDWTDINKFIESVLLEVESDLDPESSKAVRHYLRHDEFELAFEGLFLEIMDLNKPILLDFQKCWDIGKHLGLDRESVLDSKFWDKFNKYIRLQN